MTRHPRLSVHDVTFIGDPLATRDAHWQALGVRRLSLISTDLRDGGVAAVAALIARRGYAVEAVTHIFAAGPVPTDAEGIDAARRALSDAIADAARIGARSIYMLTGGRGTLAWRAAADAFAHAVEPCVREAAEAGIALAIENASSLYVDIHLAHSLADTITLAELAGIGICLDHFHCWWEADFPALVARALPRLVLVQLSDYVPGDRALPARAVPGDGAMPIAPFLAQVIAGGYTHGFDLELLGPRIDAEGRLAAARRGCGVVTGMLEALGA